MKSLFFRLRIQLAGALFFGFVIPMIVAHLRRPGILETAGGSMSLVMLLCAICVGCLLFRQFERFASVQSTMYAFWALIPPFLAVLAIVVLFRFEYNRFLLSTGFFGSLAWLVVVKILVERNARFAFAVIPGGRVDQMLTYDWANWISLETPPQFEGDRLKFEGEQTQSSKNFQKSVPGRYGIIADFRYEHDPGWLNFMADATLYGVPVYHFKQLQERMTGEVNFEHPSESEFGSLLPNLSYLKLKRLVDVTLVFLTLVISVPVCAITALLILLLDGRPILFKQERMGYRGRRFIAYKFRTMLNDDASADSTTDESNLLPVDPMDPDIPEMTKENDPRITRLGRFLRLYRVDELPQIINIVFGDMSWIGPRPEATRLSLNFENNLPLYRYRHAVRPGITGWAQVSQGHVTSIDDTRKKLRLDFYYIKNVSLSLDFLIMVKTVRTVFWASGSK